MTGASPAAFSPQRAGGRAASVGASARQCRNIILLHDGGGDRSKTVLALPQIMTAWRGGIHDRTVSELIGQTRAQLMPPLSFRERLVARADDFIFTLIWSRLSVAFILVLGIGLVSGRTSSSGSLRSLKSPRGSPRSSDFLAAGQRPDSAYNEESVIVYTINSVLESDYPKLEVIVVKRRVNDDTGELLDEQFGRNPCRAR